MANPIESTTPYTYLPYVRIAPDFDPGAYSASQIVYPDACDYSPIDVLEIAAAASERLLASFDVASFSVQAKSPFYFFYDDCPRGLTTAGYLPADNIYSACEKRLSILNTSMSKFLLLTAPGGEVLGRIENSGGAVYKAWVAKNWENDSGGGAYNVKQERFDIQQVYPDGKKLQVSDQPFYYFDIKTDGQGGSVSYECHAVVINRDNGSFRVATGVNDIDYIAFPYAENYGFDPFRPFLASTGEEKEGVRPPLDSELENSLLAVDFTYDREAISRHVLRKQMLTTTVRVVTGFSGTVYDSPAEFAQTAAPGSVNYSRVILSTSGDPVTGATFRWRYDSSTEQSDSVWTPISRVNTDRPMYTAYTYGNQGAGVICQIDFNASAYTRPGSSSMSAVFSHDETGYNMYYRPWIASDALLAAGRVARVDIYALISERNVGVYNINGSTSREDAQGQQFSDVDALVSFGRSMATRLPGAIGIRRSVAVSDDSDGGKQLKWWPSVLNSAPASYGEEAEVTTGLVLVDSINRPTTRRDVLINGTSGLAQRFADYAKNQAPYTVFDTFDPDTSELEEERASFGLTYAVEVLAIYEIVYFDFAHPKTQEG